VVFLVALVGTVVGLLLAGLNARSGYRLGLLTAIGDVRRSQTGEVAVRRIRRRLTQTALIRQEAWPEAERGRS